MTMICSSPRFLAVLLPLAALEFSMALTACSSDKNSVEM